MPNIDITGKANIEATVTTKWDDNSFQKQVDSMPLALPPPQMGEQGAENLQSLNETINSNTDSFKGNTAIMKEFGDVMPEIIKNLRHMNSVVAQTTSSLPAVSKIKTSEEQRKDRRDEYNRQNFLNFFNTGSGALQSLSGGNIGGAGIGLISGASNAVSNYSKMADMEGLAKLSKGLLIGGTALAAGAAIFKGGKALSDAYKDSMPTIFDTGKAFGTTDNDESFRLYKTVNRYSAGTNLDNAEFNSLVQNLRKQGVGNEYNSPTSQAIATSQIAATTAKWAYATGGDASQYANLAGIMSRYGGSRNVSEDFNYLVAAGKASGLNDVQIPEFLSGIQKVMEDGIAKGFTRSSTEVAQTLTMFNKMSGGNGFWLTEKGSQMLNQMNSGVASATSLSKTSDILTYQALRSVYTDDAAVEAKLNEDVKNKTYIAGGSYVNMMQLIEQGVTPQNFSAIMEAAKNASGGDVNAETEFLRDIFGLNYTGVGKLKNLDLTGMTEAEADKAIKDALSDPRNQNNETKWKNDLNRVAEALESGGAKIFGSITLPGMTTISDNVKKISDYLTKDKNNPEIFEGETKNEKKQRKTNGVSEEYDDNKALAEIEAQNLPKWKQQLIKQERESSNFEPGINGEGFINLVEKYKTFDPLTDTYETANVHPTTHWDIEGSISAERKEKQIAKRGLVYTIEDKNEMLENISGTLLASYNQSVIDAVNSTDGKVTYDNLMNALINSPLIRKQLESDVKKTDGGAMTFSEKEIQNMNNLIREICDQLKEGIVYKN